jgi:hypothetical protein
VDGKQVRAKAAKWSATSKVTVFWFDNTKVTGDDHLSSVSAYWRRPLREYAAEQMPESAGPRGERRFYQRRIDVLGARVLPVSAAMRTASVLVERNAFGTAVGFASP